MTTKQSCRLSSTSNTASFPKNEDDDEPVITIIATMTTTILTAENPFVDPNTSFEDNRNSFATDSTLALGREASLTLGTDSLIVLGRFGRFFSANIV